MLVTKFFKSAIYVLALSILSVGGAILIHSVLAYTGPSLDPPDGNVGAITSGWTIDGTDVYLSTLTNYVGIGTDSPNNQLHIKTAAGSNAELDIESGVNNYWAIYHDEDTEQLRFWNEDFVGNIGEGVGNVLIIDNDGTVLVKTPVAGDSSNAVASKGYVDAAAGGGGDASYQKQLDIEEVVLEGNWVETGKTFYSVGGNTYFCKQHVVNGSGQVAISNINEGYACRSGSVCNSGFCGSATALTYSGATHTTAECVSAGGVVYNSGSSGTLCKITTSSCPGSWSQADNWQNYSSCEGALGDACGNHASICIPTSVFINTQAIRYVAWGWQGATPSCSGNDEYWVFYDPDTPVYNKYDIEEIINPDTNRIEIGCK